LRQFGAFDFQTPSFGSAQRRLQAAIPQEVAATRVVLAAVANSLWRADFQHVFSGSNFDGNHCPVASCAAIFRKTGE
jgi:hypothetical protein